MKMTQATQPKQISEGPISSLEELKERGLYIIEDDDAAIEVMLPQTLKEKGLLISDLARLTGISRQSINAVLRKKMKPGIDFVLKISFVLGEPIEKIFRLTENAWIQPAKVLRDSPAFIDVLNLQIVSNNTRNKRIKETGAEYFDLRDPTITLSSREYDAKMKEHVKSNLEDREAMIKELQPKLSQNSVNSLATEQLKKEFSENYSKVYKKLGFKFEPFTIKKGGQLQ